MTKGRYTQRQIDIIEGKIPEAEIITAEFTRILKYANEVGDQDVIDIIQPIRDHRAKIRKSHEQKDVFKYSQRHYDRIVITVPKGTREKLKGLAQERNLSVNSLLTLAIQTYTNIQIK